VRLGDSNTVVTVDYFTADGTAKAGEDYAATNGTVTFDVGQTDRTIRIAILNDGLREVPLSEYFSVTLTNLSTNAVFGTPAAAAVTIDDNDPGIQIEFAQHWARENSESVVVAIVRGPDENMPATLDFSTSAQTATAGADYTETSGTLTFGADEKLKLITIPILNDGLKEPDERFRLTLTNATGDVLGLRSSATVTITDNDPGIEFEVNQLWVHEDQGGLRVNVSRGNDARLDPFTVQYTVVTNLTAKAGEDFMLADGILSFAAAELSKSIWVPVVNDLLQEPDERFQMRLSKAVGAFESARLPE